MATEAFQAFDVLQTLTQARSFLGAVDVYHRFVKDLSKVARPSTEMRRDNARQNHRLSTEAKRKRLETLIDESTSPLILAITKHG